ncbi:Acyltransferase family protein [Flavobacterium sp. ACN6]|nr:Acyltransferase family protein [Flavobacterium sp. ACN6]
MVTFLGVYSQIAYALILYRIRRSYLFLLTILSAGAICFVAYNSGNLLGGWSGPTFWNGCARISYSFLAGLLIYRCNWIIKNKLGFSGLAILLLLAFVMPFSEWNWLTEPFIVLFYFPLLIALGAGAILKTGQEKICVFSGKISYPLYMTHYAFLWMFGNYYSNFKPDTTQLIFIIATAVILLVGFAYFVMVIYDIPLRKYLTNKRKEKIAKQKI